MVTYNECLISGVNLKTMNIGKTSSRPVRNKRYNRRTFGGGQRPAKRLFTPEIKRYLKDWLVRRRENPYPNRDEKKYLATETGLTYIQICNWFANWRRKLKNVGIDHKSKTWGHLIKTYNDQAHGNVEQFSISSEDSIWGEAESQNSLYEEYEGSTEESEQSPTKTNQGSTTIFFGDTIQQCYQVTSSTDYKRINQWVQCNINSYTIDEKEESGDKQKISDSVLLSKWLESAAKFQPSENNYSYWAGKTKSKTEAVRAAAVRHGREEVEAAVALTTLATVARCYK